MQELITNFSAEKEDQVLEENISRWESAPDILTVREAAALIRIGRNQMYELCRIPGFPIVQFGRSKRIPKEAFKEWVEKQAANMVTIKVG